MRALSFNPSSTESFLDESGWDQAMWVSTFELLRFGGLGFRVQGTICQRGVLGDFSFFKIARGGPAGFEPKKT